MKKTRVKKEVEDGIRNKFYDKRGCAVSDELTTQPLF